ncbi:MAG: rod shape-determining protein RodA [Flavobacteriales bacterium]|nr:rod shape-determining protein RodA [Flavobacteriales bacterium]
MNKQRGNILLNVDWVIIGIYLTLCLLGVLNIYAADFNPAHSDFFDLGHRSGKQALWIGASLIIALGIMAFEGKFFRAMSPFIYALVSLLLFVVIFIARDVKGAKAWIDLGPFKLQPAEFAKFATALFLSAYLGSITRNKKSEVASIEDIGRNFSRFIRGKKVFSLSDTDVYGQVFPLAIILLPMFLILGQDDTGSALVFSSFFFVFYREGVIGRVFIVGLLAIVLAILTLMFDKHVAFTALGVLAVIVYASFIKRTNMALITIGSVVLFLIFMGVFDWSASFNTYVLWGWISINVIVIISVPELWKRIERGVIVGSLVVALGYVGFIEQAYNVLQPHQKERIEIILGKKHDKTVSFQTDQALNAIGSGGFLGKGYLEGTHTKGKWVPEQSTDYIFCTVGEEWGFFGTSFVILLFVALIFRLLQKAEKQRSKMSRIYGYSVASILFFHLLVNIGMTLQIMPVIGIPLPFMSYGGSSLFGFTALLFMFVKFDAQRLDVL